MAGENLSLQKECNVEKIIVNRPEQRNANLNEIEDEFHISKKCFLSEDFRETVRAFLEKRTPQFKGR